MEERKRILRMLAEGQISVDECEELLRAVAERRARRAETETAKATNGKRPVWPLILLGAVLIWLALANIALPLLLPHRNLWRFFSPHLLWPGVTGVLQLALALFWVWMSIDCLTRYPSDFRLLFTRDFRYEKWIWLGIVVLGQVIGAIVYFVVIREPTRSLAPPEPIKIEPEKPQAFVPKPRARPLLPWVLLLVLVFALGSLALPFISQLRRSGLTSALGPATPFWRGAGAAGLPAIMCCMFLLLFWVWMLIDCVARDYREFGTLITSDRTTL